MTRQDSLALTGTALVRLRDIGNQQLAYVSAYKVTPAYDAMKFDISDTDPNPLVGISQWAWTATPVNGQIHISRSKLIAPGTPSMWFVRMDARAKMGDSIHAVVAFITDHFNDGVVIDEMEFVMLPVHNDDQVGAITWNRKSGEIDQIYVSPESRRHNIAQRLINAAAAVHHTHSWPGVMHANGRRTNLGERFALSWQNPLRIAPHTELSPPMDPQ